MATPHDRHDYGPHDAQQRRAAALHGRSLVVDLLAPVPADLLALVSADAVASADASASTAPPAGGGVRRLDLDPAAFVRSPRASAAWAGLSVARTVGELRAVARDGRPVVYLGTNRPITLAELGPLHGLGLRMLGFGGCPAEEPSGATPVADAGGLTAHGDRLLRGIERLGLVIDVAGAAPAAAFDVAMRAARPIVTSRVALPGERPGGPAAAADELRAIASTDGVIGVGPGPSAPAGSSGAKTALDALLDRIDAVAVCVGSRYVALGLGDPLGAGSSLAADRSVTGLALTHGLVARGYTDDEILGILGENALRVFAAVWG